MPWSVNTPMSRRLELVEDAYRGLYTMTALCARYGTSRRAGYSEHAPSADASRTRERAAPGGR